MHGAAFNAWLELGGSLGLPGPAPGVGALNFTRAPLAARRPEYYAPQGPAGYVGDLYVAQAELDALETAVFTMSTDVDEAAARERADYAHALSTSLAERVCRQAGLTWDGQTCLQAPGPGGPSSPGPGGRPLTRFQGEQWTPFVLSYRSWVSGLGTLVRPSPSAYDTFRARYLALRDQWTGPLGQSTRAGAIEREGPGVKTWLWIVGIGLVVLLPFYLPVLSGMIYAIAKPKAAAALAKGAVL